MDALLLSVYFLVVFYVLYQMALTLEKKREESVEIRLDNKFAAEQTQAQLSTQPDARYVKAIAREVSFGKAQGDKPKPKKPVVFLLFDSNKKVPATSPDLIPLKLQGMSEEAAQEALQPKVIIRVDPVGKDKLRQVPYLVVFVQNMTSDRQIYIYWDRSSIEMFGQGNRIIRSTPNMPLDLMQGQVFSVVNPGQRVVSNVNTENNYARDAQTNQVDRVQPLFDLAQRVGMSKLTNPEDEKENKQSLCSLDLMIGFKRTTEPDSEMLNLLVPLDLELVIKVDKIAFPPLRWLSRKRNQKASDGNWFTGRQKQG